MKRQLPQKCLDNLKPVKKGEVRNPNGRPKGSRNAFNEAFIKDFFKDWQEHGSSVIVQVREEKPSDYLRIAASLVPRDFKITNDSDGIVAEFLEGLGDEELNNVIKGLEKIGSA